MPIFVKSYINRFCNCYRTIHSFIANDYLILIRYTISITVRIKVHYKCCILIVLLWLQSNHFRRIILLAFINCPVVKCILICWCYTYLSLRRYRHLRCFCILPILFKSMHFICSSGNASISSAYILKYCLILISHAIRPIRICWISRVCSTLFIQYIVNVNPVWINICCDNWTCSIYFFQDVMVTIVILCVSQNNSWNTQDILFECSCSFLSNYRFSLFIMLVYFICKFIFGKVSGKGFIFHRILCRF